MVKNVANSRTHDDDSSKSEVVIGLNSFSKKIEDINKNQMVISDLNNTVTEIKISMNRLNSRIERAEHHSTGK